MRRGEALPSKNSTADAIRRECRIRLHFFLLHAVCCTTQGRSINHRGSALPLDRALVFGSQRGPGHHHPSARVMLVKPPRRRPLAGRATVPALAVQQTAPPLSHSHRNGDRDQRSPPRALAVAQPAKMSTGKVIHEKCCHSVPVTAIQVIDNAGNSLWGREPACNCWRPDSTPTKSLIRQHHAHLELQNAQIWTDLALWIRRTFGRATALLSLLGSCARAHIGPTHPRAGSVRA